MVVEIDVSSTVCPECGGNTVIIQERGETVCQQCGLVVGERSLDVNHSGIRAYSKHEKDRKERTGSPMSILMPGIGLSTVIDRTKIKNPDLRHAAKWNTHLSWEKRNMLMAITELKRIGGNLNFPERVKKSAVRLYKEVFKRQLLRGRSINGMVAACAYYACKDEKVPITLQEILEEASINDNIVKKCYKILVRELNLKSNAIFLGKRDDIKELLAIADLLALTSYIEGSPNVLLEAMASNVPCLGTDVGEVKYIIGNTGYIEDSGGGTENCITKLWHYRSR